jgi:rhodanese-related sulfurtransferase
MMKRSVIFLLLLLSIIALWAGGYKEGYTDPEVLKRLIERQNLEYYLIDVRTESEYNGGFIPTAVNIPYDVLADKLPTENRDTLIIVYCRSGRRSAVADTTLTRLGFTSVFDFGGIYRWPYELSLPEN